MRSNSGYFFIFCFSLFFTCAAQATITLTSDQTDYTTTSDITETSSYAINSTLVGSASSFNKIKNSHTINTTGSTGSYGIRVAGNYNQITNDSGATIATTGNSGRGISIANLSTVINSGTISTQGTTSYGIYAGGDNNTVTSSGSITTTNTTAYGIYANGDNNSITNSGAISTKVQGIYSNGNGNSISNSGAIATTIGSSAYGIYVYEGTSNNSSATNYSTVANSGAISSNSHGIYSRDNYVQITNSGTITPTSSSSIYGINASGDNTIITNSDAGTITASKYAVYNSGSGTIINNSGALVGGVRIGSGTLNIFGGTISGTVDGTSNSGSVNIGSSTYTAVSFSQSTAFSDLDILSINSGSTLTSSAEISANSILIDADSKLILSDGFSISGTIKGLSNGAGILQLSGVSFAPDEAIGSSDNALADLNIDSDASLNSSNNIYANDITVSGSLNFYGADDLQISGNLSGSGSGVINIGSKSQKVGGNLILQSGDSLGIALKNGGSGNFTTDGTVTIDSNAKLSITTSSDQGYIASGTQYNIISSASSSSVNAIDSSNISVNGNSSNTYGLLRFTTESNTNGLVLNINRLSASEVTSNKNSQKIYQNLDKIGSGTSGELLEFQEYLGTASDITTALKQLEPQSSKAIIANSINIVNNSLRSAENRLEKIRLGSNEEFKKSFWTQAFGSSATQENAGDDEGYKANSIGMALGVDKESDNAAITGLALSYARSNIKSLDSTKTNLVDSYQLNFYGSKNFEKYFFESFGGFAWHQYYSTRAITAIDASANARFSGQTYVAKTKAGMIERLKYGLNLTPEISINFIRNDIGSYSESGAGTTSLDVQSISSSFLEGRAGINLGWTTIDIPEFPEFSQIDSIFKISYGYSFINDAPTTTSNFSGQSSTFDSQISELDFRSLKLGSEFDAYSVDDTIFSIDYNFERKTTYQSHFIALRIRQEF